MGPVFLSLPMDILDAPNDEVVVPTVVPDTRATAAGDLVARAAALLVGARRPLLLSATGSPSPARSAR